MHVQKVLSLTYINKRELGENTFIIQHNHCLCKSTMYSDLGVFYTCKIEKFRLFLQPVLSCLAPSDYHLNSTQLYFRQTINTKKE